MAKDENGADRISGKLNQAADAVEAVNQSGVPTGKAAWFIRLGAMTASLFGKGKR